MSQYIPLRDAISGTSPDRTQHPGFHLVWGRASDKAASVVVTVDDQRASAGRARDLFFALLPTSVDLDAPTNPIPTVSATAYTGAADELGDATATC